MTLGRGPGLSGAPEQFPGDNWRPLIRQLARIGKADLRLPLVIADLPRTQIRFAEQRGLGRPNLRRSWCRLLPTPDLMKHSGQPLIDRLSILFGKVTLLGTIGVVWRMEDERRLVGRVLGHWMRTVHARGFPRHDEIDPWMLGEDWANCLLIAVEEPIELSHFISVGKNLAVALCSRTNLVDVLMSHLPRVLSERRCLIVEGGAALRGARILHRSALLPLSQDGVTISHVLGAASYRPLAADEAWKAEVTETRWV